MARTTTIHPPLGSDNLKAWKLGLSAALGTAAGLAMVLAAGPPEPGPLEGDPVTMAIHQQPARTPAPAVVPAPEPVEIEQPPEDGARLVARGRVAYLRCDGALDPHSCPRDRDLEQAGWTAVDGLLDCPLPPEGLGQADIRVELLRDGEATVRLLDPVGSLDGRQVLRCLSPPLRQLSTHLNFERLIVSFRFEVIRESDAPRS